MIVRMRGSSNGAISFFLIILLLVLAVSCSNEESSETKEATHLTDATNYSLLADSVEYALVTEYFGIEGHMVQQLRGEGVNNFVIVFEGDKYEIAVIEGAPDGKGRISVVDRENKVVSVSHPSGKIIQLAAYVEDNSKMELRETKEGRKALIVRAKGALTLQESAPEWLHNLATESEGELWKAGAYDVVRSTRDGSLELAIPEGTAVLNVFPLRPKKVHYPR